MQYTLVEDNWLGHKMVILYMEHCSGSCLNKHGLLMTTFYYYLVNNQSEIQEALFQTQQSNFFCFIPMKISPNLYGRMDGSKFWCFPWFPENSLLCVILRYTVYAYLDRYACLFARVGTANWSTKFASNLQWRFKVQ